MEGLNSATLNRILWWSNYFTTKVSTSDGENVDQLRLHVARTARKEGNYGLAKRELARYFAVESIDEVVNTVHTCFDCTKDRVTALKETSKLLYSMERNSDALKVCSATALGISKSIIENGENTPAEFRDVGTRMLLRLGKLLILFKYFRISFEFRIYFMIYL